MKVSSNFAYYQLIGKREMAQVRILDTEELTFSIFKVQIQPQWPIQLSLDCTCQIKLAPSTNSPALSAPSAFSCLLSPVSGKHICPAISITFLHFNQIAFRFGLWPSQAIAGKKKKKPNRLCSTRVALAVIRKLNLQFSLSGCSTS